MFVGNLNFKTTREELEELFAQAGQIQDVFLPMDRDTGRPRGFAFVEFAEESEASAAIEKFDGHELGGRQLRVNAAEDRPRTPRSFDPDDRPFGAGKPPGKPKGSRRNIRGKKRSL